MDQSSHASSGHQNPTDPLATRRYVLISDGESYVGHALAHHILEELARYTDKRRKRWKVRVLCHSLEGMEKLMELGADVQEVDYSSLATLQSLMNHVKYSIVIPDNTGCRVSNAMNVIRATKSCNVKRVMMLCPTGTDYAMSDSSPLGEFKMLESEMRNCFAYGRWRIIRLPFIHQLFYYWNQMVGENQVLGMPLEATAKFTSVAIQDVCDAVATLVLSYKKQSIDKNLLSDEQDNSDSDNDDDDEAGSPTSSIKRIYELTSSKAYNCEEMVEKLNCAIDGSVQYTQMSQEEVREYLKSRAATQQQHQQRASMMDDLKNFLRRRTTQADRPGLVPSPHRYLNDVCINLMMDWFATAERAPLSNVTNDLRDLIGREPMDLAQFFMDNQDQFQGHKP